MRCRVSGDDAKAIVLSTTPRYRTSGLVLKPYLAPEDGVTAEAAYVGNYERSLKSPISGSGGDLLQNVGSVLVFNHPVTIDNMIDSPMTAAGDATIRRMMDAGTITTIIVGLPVAGGMLAGADVARDFLKRVLAPTADELGEGIVPQSLRAWSESRVQRGIGTITDAAKQLQDAGKAASAVPGRVLFPILQSASLEEDPDLRRMWSTMLANAADSARATDMMPAFAAILSELTPVEAVILEAVFFEKQDGEPRVGYNPVKPDSVLDWRLEYVGSSRTTLKKVTLPENDYRVMSDNLARLGLVEQVFWGPTRSGGTGSTKIYSALKLSPLGECFVAACVKLVSKTL